MEVNQSGLYWISHDIVRWYPLTEGGTICDDLGTLLRRPYRLLRHAEDKLKPSATELDLVDCISTLKRAAFDRRDAILKQYRLKHLPLPGLPYDHFERLAYLEIIRPTVLKTLIAIRNYIEHQQGQPPDWERCKEFTDYVWYFLRSTDSLLKVINTLFTRRTISIGLKCKQGHHMSG